MEYLALTIFLIEQRIPIICIISNCIIKNRQPAICFRMFKLDDRNIISLTIFVGGIIRYI
ncbi:hypothetical protein CE91St58_17420 [Lachnospiraceae bacterium]|nr:hypothetical protein CE91St58_17420 [Lachnospiraceae bacterium]